jgi:hypothetical protein
MRRAVKYLHLKQIPTLNTTSASTKRALECPASGPKGPEQQRQPAHSSASTRRAAPATAPLLWRGVACDKRTTAPVTTIPLKPYVKRRLEITNPCNGASDAGRRTSEAGKRRLRRKRVPEQGPRAHPGRPQAPSSRDHRAHAVPKSPTLSPAEAPPHAARARWGTRDSGANGGGGDGGGRHPRRSEGEVRRQRVLRPAAETAALAREVPHVKPNGGAWNRCPPLA